MKFFHFSLFPNRKKNFLLISIFCFISLIIGGFFYTYKYFSTLKTFNAQPYAFIVKKGDTFHEVSSRLQKDNIFSAPKLFYIWMRLHNVFLKTGEYQIPAFATLQEMTDIFESAIQVTHLFTVIEGSTPEKVLIDINQLWQLQGPHITQAQVVLADSYSYVYGMPRAKFYQSLQKKLEDLALKLWLTSENKDILPTPRDLIILASIIEKETQLSSERARIAGVFINRLKQDMPLQADCCVSYGLYQKESRPLNQALSRDELKIPHPFNTYVNKGLPPAPICNPGKSSLEAAANPQQTDELFYVADGTGGHVFSKNSKQHQHNHRQWRKIRKKMKAAQNKNSSFREKANEKNGRYLQDMKK